MENERKSLDVFKSTNRINIAIRVIVSQLKDFKDIEEGYGTLMSRQLEYCGRTFKLVL